MDLSAGTGNGGDAQGDTLVSIENISGSQGNDRLTGNAAANILQGWNGDDALRGGVGADRLDGGAGNDTASYDTSWAGVTVDLSTGIGSGGDAQGDILVSIENVSGSAGTDTLIGNAGGQHRCKAGTATTCSAAPPGPTASMAGPVATPPAIHGSASGSRSICPPAPAAAATPKAIPWSRDRERLRQPGQ